MPNKNKGVREYNLVLNYFLILDRLRGKSYGQLAKQYKMDKSNIRKRILGILNKDYWDNKADMAELVDATVLRTVSNGVPVRSRLSAPNKGMWEYGKEDL